jgi:predicted lipoprotein
MIDRERSSGVSPLAARGRPARPVRRPRRLARGAVGAAAALLAVTAGCGGDEAPTGPTDGFDRSAMLGHLAREVLLPIQERVAARAAALPGAIGAYCDALDAGSAGATRDAARAAWREAVDAWQLADAVLLGPAAMDQRTLRERIYAWPLLSPCGVDRDTASSWQAPASYDVAGKLPNVRSLATVEYLLYTAATAHTCAVAPAGWDALGADLPRARCRQAQKIAADVAAQAETLAQAWRPAGGDYAGQLARAGQTGSPIPSAQEGANRISDALFYVEAIVKDMKLGEAAGLTVNACGAVQAPCLRELELIYSDRASAAIRANLAALQSVFTGVTPAGDGPAFDDFLRALGQGELADRMIGSLAAAIAKAAALPESLVSALSTDRTGDAVVDARDYPEVVAAHAAIKAFTDDLKTQFLAVLALEIPDEIATDND